MNGSAFISQVIPILLDLLGLLCPSRSFLTPLSERGVGGDGHR